MHRMTGKCALEVVKVWGDILFTHDCTVLTSVPPCRFTTDIVQLLYMGTGGGLRRGYLQFVN
jgi:hypothetical protein